ncbi:hypothetical protein GGX14DRAFT_571985 [Mycena pura]|uniref:Uncharacterized protein n=1 Tax=Mycena pura TaxID=153505 RepID=A0AAD6Y7F8_9AGAR|nr:hypothetical protein GGX14DRAFT_571985 [Mycena pura]
MRYIIAAALLTSGLALANAGVITRTEAEIPTLARGLTLSYGEVVKIKREHVEFAKKSGITVRDCTDGAINDHCSGQCSADVCSCDLC